MGHWLASARDGQASGWMTRFDPVYWTVDFPRPMMAAVTTTAPDALRVDLVFQRGSDLAGLIWSAEDRHDHVLLAYAAHRDFRDVRLRFRWRSAGVTPLDAINGPVLTIEGRDAAGWARQWHVRLWNYAVGTPEDAVVTIDFAAVDGGFALPGEADPVWAGDVDRMFVTLTPPGYAPGGGAFAEARTAWVTLSEIRCDGPGAVVPIGDVVVPPHGLCIANGYDDVYPLTPARVLRNLIQLGYRGPILHYVGMSHYFRLEPLGDGFYVSLAGGAINAACAAWHADFAARAAAFDMPVIWSLSYELLDQHCWGDWKQRAADGTPAATAWTPASTLLSPAHAGAMAYLRQVALAFVAIAQAAGLAVRFQIGEPWWWTLPDGRLCIHDDAAKAALGDPPEQRLRDGGTDARVLDAAGALLAQSTLALRDAVKAAAPGAEVLLLAYLPTVLDPAMPEARRANLPTGWAAPAFERLQLEDYDWAVAGNAAASARAIAATAARLGYPDDRQDYLAGFVAAGTPRDQWHVIAGAAAGARARGVAHCFVWALPQVLRDGFVHFDLPGEEKAVQAFDDVQFPIALGREAEVAPEVSTAIVTSAGGHEMRNAEWAEARLSYDVGPGVRSEADIAALIAFFRARMGPARGFRLRDPFDWRGEDEWIGTGDGVRRRFALVRRYGEAVRRITRPVADSVSVKVAGLARADVTLRAGGEIELAEPPPPGARVTASFAFDVPVRFAEDRLQVSRATFLAGVAASVPLVEIRE